MKMEFIGLDHAARTLRGVVFVAFDQPFPRTSEEERLLRVQHQIDALVRDSFGCASIHEFYRQLDRTIDKLRKKKLDLAAMPQGFVDYVGYVDLWYPGKHLSWETVVKWYKTGRIRSTEVRGKLKRLFGVDELPELK